MVAESKKSVADQSKRVAYLEQKRKMIRAIMGGTEHLRTHKEYLPQHPAEGDSVYEQRLQRTFLSNFIGMAINKASGKVFAKEVAVAEVPENIKTLLEDIDRQGSALHPFVMDVGKQAFQDGISFVLVDVPRADGIETLADEKKLGIRPYAIHVKPSCILEIKSGVMNGSMAIERVRIKENVFEQYGDWGETEREQIRVWIREPSGLVRWELYRRADGDLHDWVLFDSGATSFRSIYLIPFYTNRVGFCEGEPPFQDVAEATIEHWQWKSEHAHALSMCCFGMYTAVGVNEEFKFSVGPAKAQISSSPEAKFGVLETTGTGVTLAAETLKAIEDRIDAVGVHLRVENGGQVTATAAALDSEETASGLKAVAKGFGDSIELMLIAFAEIMGLDPNNAGEVKVNDDFGAKHGTDVGLTELGKARALGDISRNNYLLSLKWRGELPEDFDIEVNSEELSAEEPALGGNIGVDNQ